jgi:protein-S-isoprenylcysteine O-methyltransferase Ste14
MERDMNNTVDKIARRRLGREGEHPRGDLGQLVLLAVFLAIWIADSFVFRMTTIWAPAVPLAARLAASGLILLAAFDLARRGHVVLHEETVREGRLVRDGIFGRVRHPLYLAALLFYAGMAVGTVSLLCFAALAGIFLFYNGIASYEESFLLRKHGDEYREYRRKVPKWIPRLRPARFD